MQGKIALVTGANSGIGLWTVIGLAKQGATVLLHARSKERGEAALAEAKTLSGSKDIHLMLADLESRQQIRELAENVKKQFGKLHVLVNNAAIIPPNRILTQEGIEVQFMVNHLSYFMLTHLLLDTLKANAPARIVNVSSNLHAQGKFNPNDPEGATQSYGPGGWAWYGTTKFYNVLFTYELARRLAGSGVTANVVHPGVIGTNLSRSLPKFMHNLYKAVMPKPEKGAETSVYLASSPKVEGVTGKYFVNKQEKSTIPASYDEKAQRQLWEISEKYAAKA